MKTKIKKFEINIDNNPYSPPMNIGMIFDTSNDILSQLIKFNNQKSFFENFCSEFNGDLVALINGNEEVLYYDLIKLILSTKNYLNDKDIISLKGEDSSFELKNLFDETTVIEIIKRMNNSRTLFKLINTRIIYNNISSLKNIILNNYSSYLLNFFEYFKQLILKIIS